MAAAGSDSVLRGRCRECDVLDRLLASVHGGQSRVLVIRGEPGVGKTALLEYLCQHATGCRIARAAGVESEMELAYAGLHQLCAPFLNLVSSLPGPQASALQIAFGLSDGQAPDRFLVGLAVLSLVSQAAEQQPLVCAIDDAQWLDQASAQALGFVARRLAAESVALVFAAREANDEGELAGFEELGLRGLQHDDARALLESAITGPLDERVRDRIVAETHGNPLALLELPRGLSLEELGGGFGVSRWPGISDGLRESFRRRMEPFPEDTLLLLLLAAADPTGDPLLLWRAADRLGIGPAAARPAEADELLTIGERVIFRHPLVRTVVYRSATDQARQTVHQALADVTDRDVDPARRAYHLAAGAPGPDESVALELERSAGEAQARGGLAAAASFLQRSVALTEDPARRADRALTAAQTSLQAGAFDAALGLLATAEVGPLDQLQRARVDLLRAHVRFSQRRGNGGAPQLLSAARALEPLDLKLARETYLDAWGAALFAGARAQGATLPQVSRQALAAPRPDGAERVSDFLLEGVSLAFTEGRRAAAPALKRAAAAFSGEEASVDEVLRWGWLAPAAPAMVWDYEGCVACASRVVNVARASGALTALAVGLNVLAQAMSLGGDLRQASPLAAEGQSVAEATGTEIAAYGALTLASMRGLQDPASKLIDSTIRSGLAAGEGNAVQGARWSAAILLNGLGRYEEAHTVARLASDETPELFVSGWATVELVEAAVRSGHPSEAADALERLSEGVHAAGTDWGLGTEARLRALLSEGPVAEQLFREAIDRLTRTPVRPELARAHLLYGEWLRRENRRVDARAQLRTAYEMFSAMEMEAFAGRARRELAATGEKVRRRSVETLDDLTAQETEIARLAAAGHSNPQIGAHLFLSPRTVEWHLRKVFMKLGINSRKELAAALGEATQAVAPA